MNEQQENIARQCLDSALADAMAFPQIVALLIGAGFESYLVDLRRGTHVYYLPDGDNIELPAGTRHAPVAAAFAPLALQAAIREAQQAAPGYTYRGFCAKAAAAGCAGYIVSFPGGRALYFGRTAETHVEHFPQPAQ
jgi:uncharacterized protein YbcV (DUF1398 family)